MVKRFQKDIKTKKIFSDKISYIITKGLFLRGLCFSLVYSILTMFIFTPRGISYSTEQIILRFLVYTLLFSLGGIIFSSIEWKMNIKAFERR